MNKMFRNIKSYFILLVLVGVLHSCVPTKTIRSAEATLPENYKSEVTDTVTIAQLNYVDFFNNPNLKILIDTALDNNQELNVFLQQMAVAKNEINARKGEYLPYVNIAVSSEVEKVGVYTRNGAVEENLNIKEEEAFPDPLTNYSLGIFASWELDVWKKLRNSKKAAVMEYLSTMEGKNFLVTNLVAEIANSYYELVALDNLLEIIQQNLELQGNALKMVKIQKQAARVNSLAVQRFQAEVLKNQSEQYAIKQQIIETENRINFLIGRQPAPVVRNSKNFIKRSIAPVKSGIPSQLLENRPDIRRAEYELAAAQLDVKTARANFYPSFGIKAGVGLEAFKPEFLTETPASLLYSLAGDIVGPLINRNAIKATYNNATARQLAAVYEYEKAILNGYIEVVNELSNIDNLQQNYDLKEQQVEILTQSIEVSNKLFQSARAEYIEVLLTQRDALEAKIELVETKKQQLLANVAVYRDLGGGWKK